MIPLGLLYVGGIIERCGHRVKIVDPYLFDLDLIKYDAGDYGWLDRIIAEFSPSIIGYGGIATSYGRTKRLSLYVRNRYPEILQIAGGALASVYELLLTSTGIDVVFHGETEVSLADFISKYELKEPFLNVPGISFKVNGHIQKNPNALQIENLDLIPFPAYHLIDIERYVYNIRDWLRNYSPSLINNPHYPDILRRIGKKKKYISIVTSRGCTHRCLFCYRHFQGVRQHSADYVINHIKYLREQYGIEGFQFSDELFNVSTEWVGRLCDSIERDGLDIFYLIGGARVDRINDKILNRLKETGCIEINYGQESGSDVILKEYRKGVSSKLNKEITSLTSWKAGIHCPVQLVIGSPSETMDTIRETIQFLKDLKVCHYSLNYLIPLPETPIWKFVQDRALIDNEEQYLDQVADGGGSAIINLTKMPDAQWSKLFFHIKKEVLLGYYKEKPIHYYFTKFLYQIVDVLMKYISIQKIRKYKSLIMKLVEFGAR